MAEDADGQICGLLERALAVLDQAGEQLAAIYVSQAMAVLRCPLAEVDSEPDATG